jgi:hypothetical protein
MLMNIRSESQITLLLLFKENKYSFVSFVLKKLTTKDTKNKRSHKR